MYMDLSGFLNEGKDISYQMGSETFELITTC